MKIRELYTTKEVKELENAFVIPGNPLEQEGKYRVNIIAMGDVGGTVLLGLHVLGGDVISELGIVDLNENVLKRYESEINQVVYPFDYDAMPKVHIAKDPFDCDILLFCATAGVPPVGDEKSQKDVRLAQYEANAKIVNLYCKMAKEANYQGSFFIISDPVDQLCMAAVKGGFSEEKVRGFGLGVMNARALYYAENQEEYKAEGRVYGPHGEDLVVANSITNYNHEVSLKMTEDTVTSNLKTRALGFKPYIAPAMSSAAMSVIALLRGQYHYSSLFFGEAFLGTKNRLTNEGREIENPDLDEKLYARIEKAYSNLASFGK